MERDSDHDEIIRLRERLHTVESTVIGIQYLVADLGKWRDEVRNRLDTLSEQLDNLVNADEIAQAVATRMRSTRTIHLTFVQKSVGLIAALTAIVASLKVLIGG